MVEPAAGRRRRRPRSPTSCSRTARRMLARYKLPAQHRLHRRDAARPERQALQAHAPRPVLGRARAQRSESDRADEETSSHGPSAHRRGVLPHPRRSRRAAACCSGAGARTAARCSSRAGMVCAQCLHEGTDDVELSTRGRLWTWTYCHVPLFGKKDADVPGYGVGQVDLPEGPRVQAILLGGPDDFEIGMELEIDLETLRDELRRRRGRDLPVPSGRRRRADAARPEVRGRRGRRHRHGPVRHAARRTRSCTWRATPGCSRCTTPGMTLADVDEAFVGYIQPASMIGIKAMKELGLTGLPVTHIENASATGLVAFREAAWAVSSGRADVAMALCFDKFTDMAGTRRARRRARRDRRADPARVVLRAVGAAPHARARHHARALRQDRGEELELRRRVSRCRTGSPDHVVTPEEVLASRMVARAAHHDDVLPGRRRRRVRDPRPRGPRAGPPARSPARAAAGVGAAVGAYARGHTFVGPVVGPSTMTRDTARRVLRGGRRSGPRTSSVAFCHDAFVNEELEYYELLGLLRRGRGRQARRRGRDRSRRPHPVQHRRRAASPAVTPAGRPGSPSIHECVQQLRGEADRPPGRGRARRARAPRRRRQRLHREPARRHRLKGDDHGHQRRTARRRQGDPGPAVARDAQRARPGSSRRRSSRPTSSTTCSRPRSG